ncbi:MAG: formate dehydrogenase-N subunit alpha [Rhodocyclaceae bacterium]|nr:MAG: formate dehydrogenase-N subunit alpha [Rhodocyclaceae bacterium]
MTNHWVDIKNADVVFVMGGNPAEAHPCGFKWVVEAKKTRKAKLVVVDPRFNRTASVADYYAPLRPGSDIAFLGGVINYLLTNDKLHHDYVKAFTNASFLIDEGFKFDDGIFSGYNEEKRSYGKDTWKYQFDKDGFAKVDETLQDPNCVFQLLKKHYSRYTPDVVQKVCGTPKDAFLKVCEYIASTAAPDKTMTNLYALGWTEHSVGSQNIRCMAIIQLLLGNMGMAGGGINALRGHANVQGITDFALYAQTLPGYLGAPTDADPDRATFLGKRTPKALRPGQMNFPQNFPKWFTSLCKAWYGNNATKENDFAYDYLPKLGGASDVLSIFNAMYEGKMNGFFCQGFNPLASVSNKKKVGDALAKLKYLVVIDPLATDTSEFWKPHGEFNEVDPSKIETEVFRLPATLFAETTGSFTNSGRVVQWRWKAVDGPGESNDDTEIIAALFLKLKEMYAKDGGAFPDPLMKLTWAYTQPAKPSSEELLREINGKALGDVLDPKDPTKVLVKAGDQLPSFAMLRDDGSTSCGNWIYCGTWSQAGNNTARRDNSDPSGLGQTLAWGYAWPVNRRILYNRASCDVNGKPWDAKRTVLRWTGTAWGGNDVPDMRPDAAPDQNVMPFIMNPEGVGRLFSRELMAEGPFPEHYEPFESPLENNPMHPSNPKAKSNPAARVYKGDMEAFGTAKDFPYVGTTYRLTEHFHYWTKFSKINAIMQPEQFVEIGEELAKEKGIKAGDRVKVRSNRGFIKGVAVVTKRIKTLEVDGKKVHTIGIPIHYGFKGVTKPGFITNTLTPYVGDANTQTPEYKAFLVNVEKV